MIDGDLRGVDFIAANTDAQALQKSRAPLKIQLGERLTEGLGAGNNPAKGRESAMENEEAIRNALSGSHMVFITAGFGGGQVRVLHLLLRKSAENSKSSQWPL
jgi:cell division protein FtsZ